MLHFHEGIFTWHSIGVIAGIIMAFGVVTFLIYPCNDSSDYKITVIIYLVGKFLDIYLFTLS
jgi:hypothetical protein